MGDGVLWLLDLAAGLVSAVVVTVIGFAVAYLALIGLMLVVVRVWRRARR